MFYFVVFPVSFFGVIMFIFVCKVVFVEMFCFLWAVSVSFPVSVSFVSSLTFADWLFLLCLRFVYVVWPLTCFLICSLPALVLSFGISSLFAQYQNEVFRVGFSFGGSFFRLVVFL